MKELTRSKGLIQTHTNSLFLIQLSSSPIFDIDREDYKLLFKKALKHQYSQWRKSLRTIKQV